MPALPQGRDHFFSISLAWHTSNSHMQNMSLIFFFNISQSMLWLLQYLRPNHVAKAIPQEAKARFCLRSVKPEENQEVEGKKRDERLEQTQVFFKTVVHTYFHKNKASRVSAISCGLCHSLPCIPYYEISRDLFLPFTIFFKHIYMKVMSFQVLYFR